jgi:hypothetical protein
MKKTLMFTVAAAAALLPAATGLAANPSLSEKVPVSAVSAATRVPATHRADDSVRPRVRDDVRATDGAHRNRHSGNDDAARATPARTSPTRDGRTTAHHGTTHDAGDDRRRADDSATHAGDDRRGADDSATHDAGDDRGGSRHGGHGSDDR